MDVSALEGGQLRFGWEGANQPWTCCSNKTSASKKNVVGRYWLVQLTSLAAKSLVRVVRVLLCGSNKTSASKKNVVGRYWLVQLTSLAAKLLVRV